MQLLTVHNRIRTSLVLAACLFATEARAALAPEPPLEGAIEEIEVLGQRTLLGLRMELYRAEDRMYDLFNALNSSDDMDVKCESRLLQGSHIRRRFCARNYLEEAQAENANAALRGYEFFKSPMTLWNENRTRNEQFSAEVQKLMEQSPEFLEAIADTKVARGRYAAERQKQAGHFIFSGLLDKDRE
jgi:hypothetical protein